MQSNEDFPMGHQLLRSDAMFWHPERATLQGCVYLWQLVETGASDRLLLGLIQHPKVEATLAVVVSGCQCVQVEACRALQGSIGFET